MRSTITRIDNKLMSRLYQATLSGTSLKELACISGMSYDALCRSMSFWRKLHNKSKYCASKRKLDKAADKFLNT